MIYKPEFYNPEKDNNFQNDDAVEIYNIKTKGKNYVLETCNWNAVTAACNALVPFDLSFKSITSQKIDPAMGAWIWINTPTNFELIKKYRTNVPKSSNLVFSRIPQFFCAAYELFGIVARFFWNEMFETLCDEIKNKNTLVVQLKNPGHYIMVYGYDSEKNILLCFDPNKNNKGKFDTINEKQFKENICNWYNVFYPPTLLKKGIGELI